MSDPIRYWTRSAPGAILVACVLASGGTLPGSLAAELGGDSDAALRAYHTGNGLLNRGLYDLAASEYRAFLESHGDHEKAPVARYGLAVSLFRLEKYAEAVAELTRLPSDRDFPYAAEIGTMLGQCHLSLNAFAPAAEAFQRVLREFGDHDLGDDAAAGAAEALYHTGDFDGSIEQAVLLISRWADSPLRERAEYFRALSLMSQEAYALAADRFAALLTRYPDGAFAEHAALLLAHCHHHSGAFADAQRVYRRIVDGDGGSFLPDALYGLALILQQGGNNAESGNLLDRLLERFPENALAPNARLLRARIWLDEGDAEQAAPIFDAIAQQHDPLRREALYYAAKCRLRRGDHTGAAELLAKSLDEFPVGDLVGEMSYDRAVALFRAGDHQAAAEVLASFLSRFEDHVVAADALRLLAVAEHHLRRFDESGRLCSRFLDKYGDHALASGIAFLAAENHFLSGRYEDAAAGYEAFLSTYRESPQRPKAAFRLGITFHHLQRPDDAERLLRPLANGEVDPEFRQALYALGDIAFQRADWAQADRHLSAYLKGGLDAPAGDDALLKRGLARQRAARHAEALEDFERLLNRFPDSPHRLQALFERGQTLVAMNNLKEARGMFERVLAAGESRFESYALNHLGGIAMTTGEFDVAAERFDHAAGGAAGADLQAGALFQQGQALVAAGRYAQAEEILTRFLGQHPTDTDAAGARAHLAIAVARQERYDDALALMERCDAEDVDPSLRSTLLYEQAWCLRQLKRNEEAAGAYRQLIDTKTAGELQLHALLELAGIESEAGCHEAAAELLHRLRSLLKGSSADTLRDVREQATYRLAVSEFEIQRFPESAALFDELLDAFPDSPLVASANYFCGEAFFRVGRHERAVAHLSRVVDDFPADPAYPAALLRLGESLSVLQRWARAERTFTQFLERFPNHEQWFQAQFGLGWARENQQRYEEAIETYRKVVDQHQGATAARAQFQIGECLFAKKQYEDAARELLKVDILYAYPEWSAAALYEAGRCFEKLAKTVEARQQFKQVAQRYGESNWGSLAAQRLDANMSGSIPGQ